jgi:hypothetical protein
MKEAKRDRRAGDARRPSAVWRQRKGETARTRTTWRDAIPAERLPGACQRGEQGGENRHELNIL